ncbi:hypothetical protein SAMN05444412_12322 [Rhodonellum ikkaensis]|uniref:Uncharacterized protein n=1 Tax=Rhodonellum ikkaensis TaxID=336829 RepID=A0A1H3TYA3_9BACT|nr:hypothetical protein SAMN05444412_12322 [Rhodonellum ikkaensis]
MSTPKIPLQGNLRSADDIVFAIKNSILNSIRMQPPLLEGRDGVGFKPNVNHFYPLDPPSRGPSISRQHWICN